MVHTVCNSSDRSSETSTDRKIDEFKLLHQYCKEISDRISKLETIMPDNVNLAQIPQNAAATLFCDTFSNFRKSAGNEMDLFRFWYKHINYFRFPNI